MRSNLRILFLFAAAASLFAAVMAFTIPISSLASPESAVVAARVMVLFDAAVLGAYGWLLTRHETGRFAPWWTALIAAALLVWAGLAPADDTEAMVRGFGFFYAISCLFAVLGLYKLKRAVKVG